jgi:hypothetical protein
VKQHAWLEEAVGKSTVRESSRQNPVVVLRGNEALRAPSNGLLEPAFFFSRFW